MDYAMLRYERKVLGTHEERRFSPEDGLQLFQLLDNSKSLKSEMANRKCRTRCDNSTTHRPASSSACIAAIRHSEENDGKMSTGCNEALADGDDCEATIGASSNRSHYNQESMLTNLKARALALNDCRHAFDDLHCSFAVSHSRADAEEPTIDWTEQSSSDGPYDDIYALKCPQVVKTTSKQREDDSDRLFRDVPAKAAKFIILQNPKTTPGLVFTNIIPITDLFFLLLIFIAKMDPADYVRLRDTLETVNQIFIQDGCALRVIAYPSGKVELLGIVTEIASGFYDKKRPAEPPVTQSDKQLPGMKRTSTIGRAGPSTSQATPHATHPRPPHIHPDGNKDKARSPRTKRICRQ
ncbi:unnamed protein product, partial [Mesorhabditis spiculigera]